MILGKDQLCDNYLSAKAVGSRRGEKMISRKQGCILISVCTMIIVSLLSCINAFALELSREDKIKQYEILHGNDPIDEDEEIEPAQESIPLTPVSIEDLSLFQTDKETLSLDEAISAVDSSELSDEASKETIEELKNLKRCKGTYVQKSDSGKVYTADLEIFLKYGVPTCIVDYSNYMGFLEEAPVTQSGIEEFPFVAHPIGRGVRGIGQEFLVEFSEDKMHIVWGEGSCEYILNKSSGSADELQNDTKPFAESETFKLITEKIDESFGDIKHHVRYDDENKTVTIYSVISEGGRSAVLANPSIIKKQWGSILDNMKDVTRNLQSAVTLGVRKGVYDITEGHCMMEIVDRLNDSDEYYPQDIWAIIKDGSVEYDFLEDNEGAIGNDTSAIDEAFQGTSNGETPYGSNSQNENVSFGEKNALKRAKEYLEYSAFSYQSLVGQLEFEGYSHSEATYAVDNCGADWNEQAVKRAEEYLEYSAFSYNGLIDQLVFEGFTQSQAEYGVSKAY